MARMDLDLHIYLRQEGEHNCKPLLIVDYVATAVRDVEEIQLVERATLKLGSTKKPKLSSVTTPQWIAANARIMAALADKGELTGAGVKDY